MTIKDFQGWSMIVNDYQWSGPDYVLQESWFVHNITCFFCKSRICSQDSCFSMETIAFQTNFVFCKKRTMMFQNNPSCFKGIVIFSSTIPTSDFLKIIGTYPMSSSTVYFFLWRQFFYQTWPSDTRLVLSGSNDFLMEGISGQAKEIISGQVKETNSGQVKELFSGQGKNISQAK